MADTKWSALPAATSPAANDLLVGLQGSGPAVASTFPLSSALGLILPSNTSPLDSDQFLVRQAASITSPKTLTLARARNQIVNGAPAASALALADTLLASQSSTVGAATVQQVIDAFALAPLTIGGNFTLQSSGNMVWMRSGTDFRLANVMPIVFCSGDAATGGDCGVARDAAGVVRVTDGGSGYGKIRFASSTGVGIAAFGANCPASILTAPYAWGAAQAQDGTPCVFPMYKL